MNEKNLIMKLFVCCSGVLSYLCWWKIVHWSSMGWSSRRNMSWCYLIFSYGYHIKSWNDMYPIDDHRDWSRARLRPCAASRRPSRQEQGAAEALRCLAPAAAAGAGRGRGPPPPPAGRRCSDAAVAAPQLPAGTARPHGWAATRLYHGVSRRPSGMTAFDWLFFGMEPSRITSEYSLHGMARFWRSWTKSGMGPFRLAPEPNTSLIGHLVHFLI